MYNSTLIQEPNYRRLVRDFDALADMPHNAIDRDQLTSLHGEAVPGGETEFTTEWQMASTAEETP